MDTHYESAKEEDDEEENSESESDDDHSDDDEEEKKQHEPQRPGLLKGAWKFVGYYLGRLWSGIVWLWNGNNQ